MSVTSTLKKKNTVAAIKKPPEFEVFDRKHPDGSAMVYVTELITKKEVERIAEIEDILKEQKKMQKEG